MICVHQFLPESLLHYTLSTLSRAVRLYTPLSPPRTSSCRSSFRDPVLVRCKSLVFLDTPTSSPFPPLTILYSRLFKESVVYKIPGQPIPFLTPKAFALTFRKFPNFVSSLNKTRPIYKFLVAPTANLPCFPSSLRISPSTPQVHPLYYRDLSPVGTSTTRKDDKWTEVRLGGVKNGSDYVIEDLRNRKKGLERV